ncbi:hypothetical protein H6G00_12240 [Leptolyngbya sp. FACHB-541]|uniref:hypothetical protein n=1 Tax=Leptolyngbya sp. FACHB-541 TaxID=2692810 RepID=UPI0016833BB1|nr:hypothetical protein [Leptolyngbya sp. FACHB-541]MBD1997386.1 hypothetical protein [Leptolyngbya sp. FACHB-541]
MAINPDLVQPQWPSHLRVTILVESLISGKVAASIFEFPTCRVEADTKEIAIAQLQSNFLEQLQHTEAIPWNVPIPSTEPTWAQFAGIFQNDLDFQAIMETIRAERLSEDDSEVDPAYYQ